MEYLKLQKNHSTFLMVIIMGILCAYVQCNASHDTIRCPNECFCTKEIIRCRSLSKSITYIGDKTRRIVIEEAQSCDDEAIKNLINLAIASELELEGKCIPTEKKDTVSLRDLAYVTLEERHNVDGSHERVKRAGFDANSVYSFQSKPVVFHNCKFKQSDCGWKQVQAIDFEDWRRTAEIGIEIAPAFLPAVLNGKYFDMIGPRMEKPTETKSIRMRVLYGQDGIFVGEISVLIIYPLYSTKEYLVRTIYINSTSTSLTTGAYFMNYSPMHKDYQLIIRGLYRQAKRPLHGNRLFVQEITVWAQNKVCSVGNGRSYRGYTRVSSKGYTCKHWYIDQTPFSRNDTEDSIWSNYCRNPQGVRNRPWCYTDYNTTTNTWQFDYCDIPKCNTTITANPPYPLGHKNPVAMTFLDQPDKLNHGRIAVYGGGNWFGICTSLSNPPKGNLSINALDLMCQQMGLGLYGNIYSYPKGISPVKCINPENIICQPDAKTFSDCVVTIPSSIRTSPGYWLECFPPPPNSILTTTNYQLSISNGASGIVKIRYNNQEGGICTDGWNTHSADVVCRQFGFATSSSSSISIAGATYPRALIKSVKCVGYETALSQCHVSTISTESCSNATTATISCIPQQVTFDVGNTPTNCTFKRGFCGWKSTGNLPWMWHNGNDKGHFVPSYPDKYDNHYAYVKRFPYNSTKVNALLVSPPLRPLKSGHPVEVYIDDYAFGIGDVNGNVTAFVRYRMIKSNKVGIILFNSQLAFFSPQGPADWSSLGYARDNFRPTDDFRVELELVFNSRTKPSSDGVLIDNLRVTNARAINKASTLFQATTIVMVILVSLSSTYLPSLCLL